MNAAEALGGRPTNPLALHKLRRDTRREVLLVVEAGFDARFWQAYRAPDCRVQHVDQAGRSGALRLVEEALGHPDARVLAILDPDLDRLEDTLPATGSVVWTDGHDLEATLLSLPVLEKVLAHHAGPERLEKKEAGWGEAVRDRLFRHAEGMGRIRWWKVRARYDRLRFKKTAGKSNRSRGVSLFDNYSECCDRDWTPSTTRVIQALLNYSQTPPSEADHVRRGVENLPAASLDDVVNGHDLVGFLRSLLKDELGVWKGTGEDLADLVAIACEERWLATTSMWRGVRAWETANPGFAVLRTSPDSTE